MTTRQSLIVGLLPVALLGAFWAGRASAPAPALSAAPAAPVAEAPAMAPAASDPTAAQGTASVADTGTSTSVAPPMAPMAAGAPGGDIEPNAPVSPTPDMDKKIADAEKSGDKKAISAAYTERGTAHMYDEKAGRKTKYRAALEDYRKALAADPKNQDAQAAKETIESVYKSLKLPIPGGQS